MDIIQWPYRVKSGGTCPSLFTGFIDNGFVDPLLLRYHE
jgi:hypothetical protein